MLRGLPFRPGLGRLMTSTIRRALDFHGRSSRREVWIFHLMVVFASVLLAIGNSVTLEIISADAVNYVFVALFIMLMALSAFPYASLFARRMHDLGYSGWWALILLVPLVGGLVLLALFLMPGNPDSNRFGAPPNAGLSPA